MKMMLLPLLILAGLMGTLGQEDLEDKAFIFPAESNTAAVVVKAEMQEALTSLTLCLKSYTILTRNYGIFSYATSRSDNELLIFKTQPNIYGLHVGGAQAKFVLPDKKISETKWEHICMTWESATGIVALWLDGQPLPRMAMKKGDSIIQNGVIVLGQDQDSVGGGFDINQSFVGEVKDVYMWDRVLSDYEMCLLGSNHIPSFPMINWRALRYDIKSDVILKPSLFPICGAASE